MEQGYPQTAKQLQKPNGRFKGINMRDVKKLNMPELADLFSWLLLCWRVDGIKTYAILQVHCRAFLEKHAQSREILKPECFVFCLSGKLKEKKKRN